MSPRNIPPLPRQVHSNLVLWLGSLAAAIAVFAVAVFLQWLVYDDWLHDRGVRLVGSLLAAGFAMVITYKWQAAERQRKRELLRRLETIGWMNDRIRNSLQAIECVTYASAPEATAAVRQSVDAIEAVLHEVLRETHPDSEHAQRSLSQEQPMEAGNGQLPAAQTK
jgi:thiol:disulfide interchange protein